MEINSRIDFLIHLRDDVLSWGLLFAVLRWSVNMPPLVSIATGMVQFGILIGYVCVLFVLIYKPYHP